MPNLDEKSVIKLAEEYIKKYYQTVIKMVTEQEPDIIGHLDLVKKFNSKNRFFDENALWYKEIVDETLDIKAVTEHYYFGNLAENQRNHIFLDFEATYKFKGDKWTLALRGNNLFNKQNFTTFNVSDIGYSSTSYRLMPRYLLLTAKYRFSL